MGRKECFGSENLTYVGGEYIPSWTMEHEPVVYGKVKGNQTQPLTLVFAHKLNPLLDLRTIGEPGYASLGRRNGVLKTIWGLPLFFFWYLFSSRVILTLRRWRSKSLLRLALSRQFTLPTSYEISLKRFSLSPLPEKKIKGWFFLRRLEFW